MKKVNLLYDFLISQIDILCSAENSEIEQYYNGLTLDQALLFDVFFEKLGAHRDALHEFLFKDEVYVEFEDLHVVFSDFVSGFEACPILEFERINFVLCVVRKISGFTSSVADEDVLESLDFFNANLSFESKAFSTNIQDLERNIVWVKLCDQQSLDCLLAMMLDVDLLYMVLSISSRFDFSRKNDVVVCRAANVAQHCQKNILTLLKLHMVSMGEKINKVTSYPAKPVNSSINKFDPALNYAQFVEVVGILGEYVERDDALSKFLSIYHVVENFMFRFPIVKLERSNNGAMFSIRDFKRLYKGVDVNELNALEDLVKTAFQLNHVSGNFGAFVQLKWDAFLVANAADMNAIGGFLTKVQGGMYVSSGGFAKYFASLVYKVRCSIVHNKETEYHISSENYADGCNVVFEQYLLPMLEEFVFLLLSEDNPLVWYRTHSIALWDNA